MEPTFSPASAGRFLRRASASRPLDCNDSNPAALSKPLNSSITTTVKILNKPIAMRK